MKDFPQELVDYIIDYFHIDKPTLLKTSVVCRQWSRESRVHLFQTLRITPGDSTFSPPSSIYESLLHLLRTCNFRNCIRVLDIDSLAGCGHDPTTPGCELLAPTLLEILSHLPNLSKLRLNMVRVDMSAAPPFGAHLSIPHIHLSGVFWNDGYIGLSTFLRQFSHIEYLNMGDYDVYSMSSSPQRRLDKLSDHALPEADRDPEHSNICALRLPPSRRDFALLCDFVRRSGVARGSKQLWVSVSREKDVISLKDVLPETRDTLEHMEINMASSVYDYSSGYTTLCQSFSLSYFCALRSICIHMLDHEGGREHNKTICDGIIQLISSAPAHLRNITLRMTLTNLTLSLLDDPETIDWPSLLSSIASIQDLCGLTFQFPRSFSIFEWSRDDLFNRARKMITTKLAHCAQLNLSMVKFQQVPPGYSSSFPAAASNY